MHLSRPSHGVCMTGDILPGTELKREVDRYKREEIRKARNKLLMTAQEEKMLSFQREKWLRAQKEKIDQKIISASVSQCLGSVPGDTAGLPADRHSSAMERECRLHPGRSNQGDDQLRVGTGR